jgi:hypothetical protein
MDTTEALEALNTALLRHAKKANEAITAPVALQHAEAARACAQAIAALASAAD